MEESGDLGLSLLKARSQPPDTFKSQFLDFQILGYLYMLLQIDVNTYFFSPRIMKRTLLNMELDIKSSSLSMCPKAISDIRD